MTQNTPALFQGGALPAHLQAAAERANEMNAGAATGTLGNSVDRISLKASRFRVIEKGEEVYVHEASSIEMVVLRANPNLTKAYYAKAWEPGSDDQPDCASSDGTTPDPESPAKQSETCAACPQNVWGSKINPQTGGEMKACSDSKTICVVPPGQLDGKIYRLVIPAASMKNFGSAMQQLSRVSPPIPYNAVVFKVKFDTTVSHPKIDFEPVRYLTAEEYGKVESMYDTDEAKRSAGITRIPATNVPAGIAGTNPAAQGPSPEAMAAAQAEAEKKKAEAAAAEAARVEAEQRAAAEAKAKAEAQAAAQAQAQAPSSEAASAWGNSGGQAAAQPQAEAASAGAWGGGDTQAAPQEQDAPQEQAAQPQAETKQAEAQAAVTESDDLEDLLGSGWDD